MMEQELKEKKKRIETEEHIEGVICSKEISRKCVYGYESTERCNSLGLCDYILRAGHMRGCSMRNCTKFEEITKDNPRRKEVT